MGVMWSVHYLDYGGILKVFIHVKSQHMEHSVYSLSFVNYITIKPFLKSVSQVQWHTLIHDVEASLGNTARPHQNNLSITALTCNPNTWETKAKDL